jgi:hypothetical protein
VTDPGFWQDGTQEPPPPPLFPDPLAGLLTGVVWPVEPTAVQALAVARPVAPPGETEVDAAMRALFADDSRRRQSRRRPDQPSRPTTATLAAPLRRNKIT